MNKKVKNLKAGDVFLDSFGLKLEVTGSKKLPWSGIPRTMPMHRVYFITEAGNEMYGRYYSDQEVIVV